jgi:DNA-directed RNA polymerase specialized sigma24 family protein
VRREEEAAFEVFVAGSGSRLLRLAVLLTGDVGHAEDLVQTALGITVGTVKSTASRALAELRGSVHLMDEAGLAGHRHSGGTR